jgi:predicted small lipoprotein YifL
MTIRGARWGLIVAAVLAMTAVTVSGCGRKGDLEPPAASLNEGK